MSVKVYDRKESGEWQCDCGTNHLSNRNYCNGCNGGPKGLHTPAPWTTNGLVYGAATITHPSWDGNSHPIARAYCRLVPARDENGGYVWDKREAQANARLIAAAPDLLQACIDCRNAYQEMFDVMPVAWQTFDNILEQAINKATSE